MDAYDIEILMTRQIAYACLLDSVATDVVKSTSVEKDYYISLGHISWCIHTLLTLLYQE